MHYEVDLSSLFLPEDGPLLRVPPRPVELRQERYDQLFDYSCVFMDAFQSDGKIYLIGPPYLNLADSFSEARFLVDGRDVSHLVEARDLDRVSLTTIDGIQSGSELKVVWSGGSARLVIQPDLREVYAGSKVLVTQSKNNDITWIVDWINFHIKVHGINAVLIYDNESDVYDVAELRNELEGIPGLDRFSVVSWPYKFGPTGSLAGDWDSDFGQLAAWEHARRRLIGLAKAVIFADVDELILCSNGGSVVEVALEDTVAVLLYPRRNIVSIPGAGRSMHDSVNSHRSYWFYDKFQPMASRKYTVIPSRLPDRAQLKVHGVSNASVKIADDVLGRHFEGLRMNWRNGSWGPVKQRYPRPGEMLVEDSELKDALDKL